MVAGSEQGLGLTYTWTAYNGWSVISGGSTPTATIKAPDTYAVSGTATVEVSDTNGRYALVPIPVSTVGNRAPVINAISASPNPITLGGLMAIAVTASDPDGDTPSYTWQASQGWTIATGQGTSAITVTAPTQYGVSGTVTVTVDDGHGSAVSWSLPVSTYFEFLPSITVSPQPVITSTTLTCNGYYPLNNTLTFNWTVGGLPITTGNPGVWNSPGLPGSYVVGVTVEDGNGIAISTTTPIQVNSISPWPMFHGNIQLTGQSPIDTSSITNTITWTTSLPISPGATVQGVGSPVIGADGTIYIGNSEQISGTTDIGYLYAPNPTYGTVEWSYPTGPMMSPPVVGADGTIYAGSLMPYTSGGTYTTCIYALSWTGGLKWSHTFSSANIIYPPTIGADGTIYVAISSKNNGSYLYALNPTDGSVKWVFYGTGGLKYGPEPAIGTDGTIYLANYQSLYAINPNGSSKWTITSSVPIVPILTTPVIDSKKGMIIIGRSTELQALSITNGALKWTYPPYPYPSAFMVYSQLAIGADGMIYFGVSLGFYYPENIFALTSAGGLNWSYTTSSDSAVNTTPAIGADGTVYFGTADGYVYAFH